MIAPQDLPITDAPVDRVVDALRLPVEKKAPLHPKNLRLLAALDYLAMAMPKA